MPGEQMQIDKQVLENLEDWMKSQREMPDGWVYLGDKNERYLLGQPGGWNMLVFGVNPSTAVPGHDDPTIRKVRKAVAASGYEGWIMVNLYPIISTHPKELPAKVDPVLVNNNLRILKAVQKTYPIGAVWAAWGDAIDTRLYLGEILYDIVEVLDGDFQWYYRGAMTKHGNPRHPLYLKEEEKLVWFPVADYAAGWKDFGIL